MKLEVAAPDNEEKSVPAVARTEHHRMDANT